MFEKKLARSRIQYYFRIRIGLLRFYGSFLEKISLMEKSLVGDPILKHSDDCAA
jgi:hypothetical protein